MRMKAAVVYLRLKRNHQRLHYCTSWMRFMLGGHSGYDENQTPSKVENAEKVKGSIARMLI